MKIKIKTFNGELPTYLTEGKEYEILHFKGYDDCRLPVIHDDEDYPITACVDYCNHLNGGSWEIVNE